jgi:hypothetical protein
MVKTIQQHRELYRCGECSFKYAEKEWAEKCESWCKEHKSCNLRITAKLSSEGPCCCKCWHYFVNEGIAKKMMKHATHTAEQFADYWDASSICGGESHGAHA